MGNWIAFLFFAAASLLLVSGLVFPVWRDQKALAKLRQIAVQHGALSGEWDRTKEQLKAIADQLESESAQRVDAQTQLRPLKEQDQRIHESLGEMKRVWLGDYAHRDEAECQKVLADNLWVLSPDYIINAETFITNPHTSLAGIFKEHFPEAAREFNDVEWKAFIDARRKPDMCGFVETTSAISPGHNQRDRVYLIVELKAANVDLGWKELEQAHAYAFGLFQNAGDELRKAHIASIDCLVIGRDASKVNDAHLRWGPNAHDAIRVIPISYKQLYDRAERLAKLLMRESYARRNVAARTFQAEENPS